MSRYSRIQHRISLQAQEGMASTIPPEPQAMCRHEAFLYGSQAEFLERTTAFVREGLAAGEPIIVALDAAKLEQLRGRLGVGAGLVKWVDITNIGGNPARITSVWLEFAIGQGSRPLRGIGEPIWPERGRAELLEAQRHEALLNVALAETPALQLLCPYDLQALDPAVIAQARRTHPLISEGGAKRESPDYPGDGAIAGPFDAPLSESGASPLLDLPIQGMSPPAVYRRILEGAVDCGFASATGQDLALAVLAANEDFQRGHAPTWLRLWPEPDRLICELSASLRLRDPLAGRRPPSAGEDGRGVWLANQLCDLVELRSFPARTVTRLHIVRR